MCVAWFDLILWTPRGLRITQKEYFTLLNHTKKLLLVIFYGTTEENGASSWTHKRTNGQADGWTDRRGIYLDLLSVKRYRYGIETRFLCSLNCWIDTDQLNRAKRVTQVSYSFHLCKTRIAHQVIIELEYKKKT